MGEPLKSLSARARLGAALPAHYPGTPANFEDVSDESTLALSEVLSAISTEDAALVNQIRRFRGPWLLSRADDHDHKILTASKTFVADMKYARGALVGHNCKKLQGTKRCAVNDSCNKQLSAAFRSNEDVHVVLRNYDGDGNGLRKLAHGPRAARRERNGGLPLRRDQDRRRAGRGRGGAQGAAQEEVQIIQEACSEEAVC